MPTEMDRRGDAVATEETDRLIASDKVEGTAVYSTNGERLGSIYNFMVDKRSGRVAYAVMSFGGLFGLGERYYPLPWDKLTYETRLGGYVVDVDPTVLQGAPAYATPEPPWNDPAYVRSLYGYYGVPYL